MNKKRNMQKGMPGNIDLSSCLSNDLVISAMLFSALTVLLGEKGHAALAKAVEWVRWNEWTVTIRTGSPIVNSELSLLRGAIKDRFQWAVARFGFIDEIRLVFR